MPDLPDSSADQVFTLEELMAYLKIPRSTAYKLAQERKIPGQKVGKHWRFRKAAIDRWLDKNNEGGRPDGKE